MIVFIDLLFFINLLMDAALLQLTAWSRKVKVSYWRLWCAAGIGALYVVMMFFPSLSFLYTFVIKCGFAILMIWIAFGFTSLQHFLRNLGVFYFINFTAAGGMLALHYFLQTTHEVFNGMVFTSSGGLAFQTQMASWFIIISFVVVIWFFKKITTSQQRRNHVTEYIASLEVTIEDSCSVCSGLIDTGNQLYDPLTRIPVMVMEASKWKHILPAEWIRCLAQNDVDEMMKLITEHSVSWQDRLRLVPYKGIHADGQFMLAFRPDKVLIHHQGGVFEASRVLVALNAGKLSSDGSYQAIIHPSLMENGSS